MTIFFDPEQEHTDAVPLDRFDRAMWDEVRESGALEDMIGGLRRKHDHVEDFTLDVFDLLAKGDPNLRSPQEMRATHIPNRQIVEDIASLPELAQLRQFTVGDGFASAMGLLSMSEQIASALARAQELAEQAAAAQETSEAAAQAAQEAADNPDDLEAQGAAKGAATAAQEALEQLQADATAKSAGLRRQLRDALKNAAKEAEEAQEVASAYGVGPADLQRMNFADRATLAKQLSGEKLRKFAQLVGAFRQLASAEYRKRVTDVADETVGVEFGDDLTRLTTQELLNLASPELEDDFWLRFTEGGLLVKKLRGREREGRGPIVYVGDESSSMAGAGEMWMKGLALALLDQATRQKRDFHYIGFAGPRTAVREFAFPAGRTNRLDVLSMAEGFLNGGTSFEEPLRRALDLVTASGAARPDVVFVTDGEAPLPSFLEEWNATRRRLTAKCFGIYVTSGYGSPALLAEIVDDVRTVQDLTDVQQARDILRQS